MMEHYSADGTQEILCGKTGNFGTLKDGTCSECNRRVEFVQVAG